MKKFTTLLTMAFIALMSISFTSCDDDSDIAGATVGSKAIHGIVITQSWNHAVISVYRQHTDSR